jgi:hypothetical protein
VAVKVEVDTGVLLGTGVLVSIAVGVERGADGAQEASNTAIKP